jgi:hypothetical protein
MAGFLGAVNRANAGKLPFRRVNGLLYMAVGETAIVYQFSGDFYAFYGYNTG